MLVSAGNTGPGDRGLLLSALQASGGWSLYVEKHRGMVKAMEEKIFDPETPTEELRILQQARLLLIKDHDPDRILKTMTVQARNELQKEQR